jgi:hypothetical protein
MARFYAVTTGLGGGRVTRTGSRKSGVNTVLRDNGTSELEVHLYSADPDTPRRSRDCNDENMVDIRVRNDKGERVLFSGTFKQLEEACDTGRLPRRE